MRDKSSIAVLLICYFLNVTNCNTVINSIPAMGQRYSQNASHHTERILLSLVGDLVVNPSSGNMNLKHYVYFSNKNFFDYEFYSDGPKGKVKKVVRFTRIANDRHNQLVIFNLGFGDDRNNTGIIDDSSVTNNEDRNMVLATVANIVIDFYSHHGNCYVYAEGSTPSRTRLYQISIAGLLEEINLNFEIFGLRGDNWHSFERNVNYDAFLVKRK